MVNLTRPNRTGTFARTVGAFRLLAAAMLPAAAPAAADVPLEFDGRIEAVHRAEVATRINGRIAKLHFSGGERVAAGDPLIELDSAGLRLAAVAAQAQVKKADARAELAAGEVERVRALAARNATSVADLDERETMLAVARAEVDIARAELDQSRLQLANATIRAPIDGVISRPRVVPGSFVEAKEGEPLATIVALDPVFVAYQVPYATRLQSIERSGAESLEALFERITLTLELPDGQHFAAQVKPDFASAVVDPETGTVRIWARVPNDRGLLRPGMTVRVLSSIEGVSDVAGRAE